MLLHCLLECRQGLEISVCKGFFHDFPTLFCRIYFGAVFWKIDELNHPFVSLQELLNPSSFVPRCIVQDHNASSTSLCEVLQEFYEVLLILPFVEHHHEFPSASCSGDMEFGMGLVYSCNRPTTFQSPASQQIWIY